MISVPKKPVQWLNHSSLRPLAETVGLILEQSFIAHLMVLVVAVGLWRLRLANEHFQHANHHLIEQDLLPII